MAVVEAVAQVAAAVVVAAAVRAAAMVAMVAAMAVVVLVTVVAVAMLAMMEGCGFGLGCCLQPVEGALLHWRHFAGEATEVVVDVFRQHSLAGSDSRLAVCLELADAVLVLVAVLAAETDPELSTVRVVV